MDNNIPEGFSEDGFVGTRVLMPWEIDLSEEEYRRLSEVDEGDFEDMDYESYRDLQEEDGEYINY